MTLKAELLTWYARYCPRASAPEHKQVTLRVANATFQCDELIAPLIKYLNTQYTNITTLCSCQGGATDRPYVLLALHNPEQQDNILQQLIRPAHNMTYSNSKLDGVTRLSIRWECQADLLTYMEAMNIGEAHKCKKKNIQSVSQSV